jgi:hypothetical protein
VQQRLFCPFFLDTISLHKKMTQILTPIFETLSIMTAYPFLRQESATAPLADSFLCIYYLGNGKF